MWAERHRRETGWNEQGRRQHRPCQAEVQSAGAGLGQRVGQGRVCHERRDGRDGGSPGYRAGHQIRGHSSRKRGYSRPGWRGHRTHSKGCHQACQRGGRQGREGLVGPGSRGGPGTERRGRQAEERLHEACQRPHLHIAYTDPWGSGRADDSWCADDGRIARYGGWT